MTMPYDILDPLKIILGQCDLIIKNLWLLKIYIFLNKMVGIELNSSEFVWNLV